MREPDYRFFQNKACQYFPCHQDVAEEDFNCLFCYCPLYALGRECGGSFVILPNGVKSCERCTLPHGAEGYDRVMKRIGLVIEKTKAPN